MKKNANNPYSKFRNGVERHVHHVATSASRSNSRYNLNETHASNTGWPRCKTNRRACLAD